MKELSIEEKAKAYDEALRKVKDMLSYKEVRREDMEYIFPELKESEDEKIRKALLNYIYDVHDDDEERARWIAWLKNQGEQKPTDKIEPKFHKGDWVVTSYGKVNQVIAVDKDGDGFTLDDDTYFSGSWKDMYHLWTIEDAKDGDVLAYNDGSLTIFCYRLSGLDAGLYMSHILLTDKIEFKQTCAISNVHPAAKEQRDTIMKAMADAGYTFDFENKKLKKIEQKPAWSEEDEYYCGIIQYILNDECVGKADKENAINWFKTLKDRFLPQQKQEWSEEDEKYINALIDKLETLNFYNDSFSIGGYSVYIIANWLKSLKDRVTLQPRQELSENDGIRKELYNWLLNFKNATQDSVSDNEIDSWLDWVKSFYPKNQCSFIATEEELATAKKDAFNEALDKIEYNSGEPTFDDGWSAAMRFVWQKQWKPTEEQLIELRHVISGCSYDIEPLVEIEEHLKKLKE